MSTLSHTYQHTAIRTRLALVVMIAGAFAVLAIALISSSAGNPGSISSAASRGTPQEQLQSVAGPRYRVESTQPSATHSRTPQQQLESVAGPRYGLTPQR
jgi:hypothetical protein